MGEGYSHPLLLQVGLGWVGLAIWISSSAAPAGSASLPPIFRAAQTSLPSDWIGGDRLAIHGTTGAVGAAESHGCIRATDATMRLLFECIPLGTPVFVCDSAASQAGLRRGPRRLKSGDAGDAAI